jgi:hypothetical protein
MRGITKSQLQDLLMDLPSKSVLTTGASGNILIKVDGKHFGYIDINDQTVHLAGDKK